MGRFFDALESDRFVVTAELNPPKGTELGPLLQKARSLDGRVDAFNVTGSHSSLMAMAPMAVAHRLLDEGIEPILQITCRDRNRIALQSDLLGASSLGVSNLLCMTGDPPGAGDHPDTKPVFDLEPVVLLKAISSLEGGKDMGGADLNGTPAFFPGAARNLDTNLSGVTVPDAMVRELDGADDRRRKSVEIAARVIRSIQPMCQGVHIMAIGWEARIPEVLEQAEILRAA